MPYKFQHYSRAYSLVGTTLNGLHWVGGSIPIAALLKNSLLYIFCMNTGEVYILQVYFHY